MKTYVVDTHALVWFLSLDIHDSLIVGTALAQANSVTAILTRDEAIINSGLTSTIW
jgi:hypothetical protein